MIIVAVIGNCALRGVWGANKVDLYGSRASAPRLVASVVMFVVYTASVPMNNYCFVVCLGLGVPCTFAFLSRDTTAGTCMCTS
jgi:hypothetical protein